MSPAAERVMARADALAAISETPDALTRVYLSAQHLQANQLVGQWMSQAGMTVWQDSVGNICGRYEGAQEGAQAVLLGSHLDTVRNAGRYDGMLGVLTAIEVVDSLHQQGLHLAQAIEIVGFCDEEGTRFGITLLGSRGLTGTWPQDWLEKPTPAASAWRRQWCRWGSIPAACRMPHAVPRISAPTWSCTLNRGRALSRTVSRSAWWKPSTARVA
jgi:allantoate deiminase